jgi:hypothetical protein
MKWDSENETWLVGEPHEISAACEAEADAHQTVHDDDRRRKQLLQVAADEISRLTFAWESDKRIFRGAWQLIKEAGLSPGSQELIAAASRFDMANAVMSDPPNGDTAFTAPPHA